MLIWCAVSSVPEDTTREGWWHDGNGRCLLPLQSSQGNRASVSRRFAAGCQLLLPGWSSSSAQGVQLGSAGGAVKLSQYTAGLQLHASYSLCVQSSPSLHFYQLCISMTLCLLMLHNTKPGMSLYMHSWLPSLHILPGESAAC